MPEVPYKDWKAISEAASREHDPKKLMDLIEQLNRALVEREQEARKRLAIAPQLLRKFDTRGLRLPS